VCAEASSAASHGQGVVELVRFRASAWSGQPVRGSWWRPGAYHRPWLTGAPCRNAGQQAGPEGPAIKRVLPGEPFALAGQGWLVGMGAPAAAAPAGAHQAGGDGPPAAAPPAPVPTSAATTAASPAAQAASPLTGNLAEQAHENSVAGRRAAGWRWALRALGLGSPVRSSQARRRQRSQLAQQSVGDNLLLQRQHRHRPRLGRQVVLHQAGTLLSPQARSLLAFRAIYCPQFDGFPTPAPGARTIQFSAPMAGAASSCVDITYRAPACPVAAAAAGSWSIPRPKASLSREV